MATHHGGEIGQTMARTSPSSSLTNGAGDRNHVRGIVLTSRATTCTTSGGGGGGNGASTTTAGVIVATAETSRATSTTEGNKKAIEASLVAPSFARKPFYATSSGGNVNADRHASSPEASSSNTTTKHRGANHHRSKVDECGIWERLSPRQGDVQKTSSQDSIIVRAQTSSSSTRPPSSSTTTDALDRSPSDEDDLASSVYSQSSTSTIIKRFDKKSAAALIDQRTEGGVGTTAMSELPSYELASAYIKTNAYAQMSNSKSAASAASGSALGNSNIAMTTVTSHQPYSYDKINQYDQSPTTPTGKLAMSAATSAVISQQQTRQSHMVRESSLEPIGEEERLVQMTQAVMNSQPSRSKRAEVLRYFAAAKAFQIKVVGGDIQITDSDGCPLFDAYQELDCRQRWWNIEAYGDRVLLMREELSFGDGSSSWGSRVTITDWNGEIFGYLITGDPMRLENVERMGIARFFSQPAIVNNAACSNATSVPKACWICQSGGEDGREQVMARLEAYQRIVFLGDGGGNVGTSSGQQHLNFHLKLMVLAGVIRLVGALTVTPVSDCLALTKFFCNCCSYK